MILSCGPLSCEAPIVVLRPLPWVLLRNDVLKGLPLQGVKQLLCWADCGTHFRSYEFLWNLAELCESTFPVTQLNFFAEHHGKGRCDGAFGLQRRWVAEWARTHTITSLETMREALEAGAATTMRLDPPPHGPSYKIKVFVPEPKSECKKLDVSGTGLQIEYTYCVQFDRASGGHVRVWNYWFSDRAASGKGGDLVGRAKALKSKVTDEWRVSYRAAMPERSPLNIALLQRRKEKQQAFADLTRVSRRDPFLVALRKREKRQEHQKRKYQRQKRVLAVNLEEASASSGSDDSSDSGA